MSKCTMCIDRLEKGEIPICVASCPLRAFDFGTLEEIERKYGNLRQLEGMPDPDLTKPNFIVKENVPKKELIPYDKEKALELMQQRGELGTVFECFADVTEVDKATVHRSELKMKHVSTRDLIAETRVDLG